ncbi:Uu.00g147050.m01.CDS01 [Anthostomella pinea]|uniref:Uu.00g147050.m01.CDS01 n=1 Tax=Anthostomella pinea TaxID=933095 RepID=A0AAI8YM19_9PEZI|nr:Uu.00g147050.m01.CDS01 [Anthostomella pinea]
MAPLCKFWQQGNCRNGSNCRFEHSNANSNPFGAPSANTNRFGALSSGSNKPQDMSNPYKVTKDSIKVDLADERPTWIMSCYGPGRDAPEQLFGGYPREQSLEEVMMYIRGSENQQQAMTEVMGLYNQAEQQIQTTLGNLDGAVQFVLAGENNHPNRIDICKQNAVAGGTSGAFARDSVQGGFSSNPLISAPSTNQNPFSSAPQASPFGGGTPSFGQPSGLGQNPNPFGGAPSSSQFGQPSQMGATASAFGQSSQMGAAAPTFGQASQVGASAPAFGQASTLGQKPNPFGAGSSGPSGFGQAAQTQSAFGQPSSLGQNPNPFGSAAASASPAPFGQQPAAATSSPFGQPAGPASSSPFAQPAAASSSPFGQPAASSSGPFGQPAASSSGPFGQPAASNPFAQPTPASNDQSMDTSAPAPGASNPFGQPSSSGHQANNAFGAQPSGCGTAAPSNSNPFGQPQTQPRQPQAGAASTAKSGPYPPGSTKQHPPIENYTTQDMNGRISSFNGRPVMWKWKVDDKYVDSLPPVDPSQQQRDAKEGRRRDPPAHVPGIRKPDGSWMKVFFPNGPPAYNEDTEPDPAEYEGVKAAYATMAATGRFEGDVPEVPPMREDCMWTF